MSLLKIPRLTITQFSTTVILSMDIVFNTSYNKDSIIAQANSAFARWAMSKCAGPSYGASLGVSSTSPQPQAGRVLVTTAYKQRIRVGFTMSFPSSGLAVIAADAYPVRMKLALRDYRHILRDVLGYRNHI